MNELFKSNAAKILACYNNTDDLEKGGIGSGKYQHKHGQADTKKKSIAKNDILINSVDIARKYPSGSIIKVSDNVAKILVKTNLVGGKFVKEASLINDLGNNTYDIKIHSGVEINKSEESDLEKSEGSRGGKVIGHTKSGKPIYESHSHEAHKNFSKDDHSDAVAHHMKEARSHNEKTIELFEQGHGQSSLDDANKFYDEADDSNEKTQHHVSMAKLHSRSMNSKINKNSKSSDNSQGFGGGNTESDDDGSGKAQDREYKK